LLVVVVVLVRIRLLADQAVAVLVAYLHLHHKIFHLQTIHAQSVAVALAVQHHQMDQLVRTHNSVH
jgi:hypothetical protein